MATVGIILTVSFLFWARATVKPLAVERLARAEQNLADVTREIDRLTRDGAEVDPGLFTRQAAADVDRNYRRDRLDYGSTLTEVNVPILFLNLVLVIAAAVIGYATAKGEFSSDDKHYETEEAERLNRDIDTSRAELARRRNAAHDALRQVDRSLTRLRHLRGADVLKDFEA